MSDSTEQNSVNIPSGIIDDIEARLKYTKFENSEEYITFVLEELLHQVETHDENTEADEINEQEVQDRLKSLGYLNE